ncbi:MAG: pseudouridine synthase, partial [Planctomycetes bacterium]|nr:pseudouridine synthase [Planctomycetota bacterium]
DPETEVVEEDPNFQVDEAALQRVIPSFVGEIMQVPPLFSAKKVDGKRAYKLARKGSEHELDAVPVVLEKLALLSCEDREARIEMTCGSGFYVRSLARDLAAALGTVGYLKDLRRTECGGFKLDECVKLRDALDAAQPIAR